MMKTRIIAISAVAFIVFHVVVLGGAGAYVAHLAGFNVPFLDHGHAAADELSGQQLAEAKRLKVEEGFRGLPYEDTRGVCHASATEPSCRSPRPRAPGC